MVPSPAWSESSARGGALACRDLHPMIETATGLVLRTRPLTETSLIVQWLTPSLGRLATVAKGARRPKSPFRGKLDLFYLADFSFSRSPRSELHTLREVSLRETHSALARRPRPAPASLVLRHTWWSKPPRPRHRCQHVFDLMIGLLAHLAAQPPPAPTIFAFELKLLTELGLKPDLDRSKLNAGTKQLVQAFTESDWPVVARLRPSHSPDGRAGSLPARVLDLPSGESPEGERRRAGSADRAAARGEVNNPGAINLNMPPVRQRRSSPARPTCHARG